MQAEDSVLSQYLEVGDRIAVKHFCMENGTDPTTGAVTTKRKKESILCRLRKKIAWPGQHSKDSDDSDEGPAKKGHLMGNVHASKKTRVIDIGWIHDHENDEDGNMYRQVRAKQGGLPRRHDIRKEAVKDEILVIAKEKFFVNGRSKLGNWDDFTVNILDFAHEEIDDKETVGQIYERTGVKRLRFYLATKTKKSAKKEEMAISKKVSSPVSDFKATTSDANRSECLTLLDPSVMPTILFKDTDSDDLYDPDFFNDSEVIQFKPNAKIDGLQEDNNATLPYVQHRMDEHREDNNTTEPNMHSDILAFALASAGIISVEPEESQTSQPTAINFEQTADRRGVSQISSSKREAPPTPPHLSLSTTGVPSLTLNNNIPLSPRSPSPPPTEGEGVRTIRIHRVRIEQEMIGNFLDPSIMFDQLKFVFVDEKGIDVSGVSREAYVTFWDEFMKSSTKGELERIPLVKPAMQKDEWEAVGRIMAKGFIDNDLFPLKLSKVFTLATVYGEDAITSDDMLVSLMHYVAPIEKDAIQKALDGNLDDEDDYDDFVEVLTRLGSKTIPKGDQVKPTILRVAQKELIQTSKYALDAISSIAKDILCTKLPTPQSIREMYERKSPTNRRVLKLLEPQELSCEQEDRCFSYLKQYVKALDHNLLLQFLRHVTGADMICVNKIEVHFNNRYGINRIPIVRTCTPMIELSTKYSSYPDLRTEFNELLKVHHPLDID